MSSELNLSVPEYSHPESGRPSKTVTVLLVMVLLAVVINIAVVLLSNGNRNGRDTSSLTGEAQRTLALKLEEQGLYDTAIEAWTAYLGEAANSEKDIAMIWYRIGKLYQKKGDYEHALAGYYRSESYAKVDDISDEIGRNVRECLELMGKFAALSHELHDRVGMASPPDDGKNASDKTVLAEIGPQKITRQEFEQHIESQIDRRMAQFASRLSIEQRNEQKEALLKQISSPEQLQKLLNQYVLEEVLYRKAREDNLVDDPDVRALLKDQERALLSTMVIEEAYKSKINITDSDLETYYKANENNYIVKEKEGARKQTFEEVKKDIFQTLRTNKEQEIQQQLLNELKTAYDVVIHPSAFSNPEPNTQREE